MSMNYWSACSHKFVWSWRTPRGLERCSVKDRERTVASRHWVRARRTTRLRSIVAVGPAPAWRCAIYLTRSGRVTASQRVVRIYTFYKRVPRTVRFSVVSIGTDRLNPQNDLGAASWTSMETSYASEQSSNMRVFEATLVREKVKYRPLHTQLLTAEEEARAYRFVTK